MKLNLILAVGLIITGMFMNNVQAQVKIGVFADCQYCDCETAGNRFYSNSLTKLNDCISEFNKDKDIDFVIGLGDLIDRDFKSFVDVNEVLKQSNTKVFHVTGNHDLSVEENLLDNVPKALNLSETYYSFNNEGWKFIFLNGNEVTLQSTNPVIVKQAKEIVADLTSKDKPNNKEWNGGMSKTQIEWMEKQLMNAEKEQQKVILFCHYPLLPFEAHALWNTEEVLSILEKHGCVKAWINGHNHAGNYAMKNGIHFITLKGMVDTETENAFSIVSFSKDKIEIEGFGREVSRSLPVR